MTHLSVCASLPACLSLLPGCHPPTPRPHATSVPAEVDLSGAVCALLDQWLVELAAGARVDVGPAEITVVLQTGDVGAEERGELAPAACALALVTQLVVKDVGLHQIGRAHV